MQHLEAPFYHGEQVSQSALRRTWKDLVHTLEHVDPSAIDIDTKSYPDRKLYNTSFLYDQDRKASWKWTDGAGDHVVSLVAHASVWNPNYEETKEGPIVGFSLQHICTHGDERAVRFIKLDNPDAMPIIDPQDPTLFQRIQSTSFHVRHPRQRIQLTKMGSYDQQRNPDAGRSYGIQTLGDMPRTMSVAEWSQKRPYESHYPENTQGFTDLVDGILSLIAHRSPSH